MTTLIRLTNNDHAIYTGDLGLKITNNILPANRGPTAAPRLTTEMMAPCMYNCSIQAATRIIIGSLTNISCLFSAMLDVSEQVELELSSPNSKVSRNPAKFCNPFIDLHVDSEGGRILANVVFDGVTGYQTKEHDLTGNSVII